MEANAPEKIYLYPSSIKEGKILGRWFKTRYNQDSIEYVRADAFIEKAAEWFSEIENGTTIADIDKFVEDFKKAMKGE